MGEHDMSNDLDLLLEDIKKITVCIQNKEGNEIEFLSKRVSLINSALVELCNNFDEIFRETEWSISSAPMFSVYCYKLPDELWSKFNTLSTLETQKNGGTIRFNVDDISVTVSCNKQGNYAALSVMQCSDAIDNLKTISKFLFKHKTIFVDTSQLQTWIAEQVKLVSLANNLISPSFKIKEIK